MSYWIMGLFAAFCGMVGLFMASGAHDAGIYAFGMLMFGGAILFCWWMIKTAFDEAEELAPVRLHNQQGDQR